MISLCSRSHGVGARGAGVFSIVLLLFLVLPVPASTRADATRPVPQALPLIFELNAGQTSSDVKFLSRGAGYTLFLTPAEMVLGFATSPSQKKAAVLRMQLPGANVQPRIAGVEELPGKVNYFIGDDPARWRTNVPTYAKVRYESIYPGVDLIYYGNQRQFEYDFVVAPGADPKVITLAFEGPEKLALDPKGDLVFQIGDGELRLQKPLVYQEVAGSRKIVAANYILRSQNRVGVQVAAYDRTRPLVIDPVLVYSTYLGGSGLDIARGIAADPATPGIVYVAGETSSTNFPTTAGFQPTFGKGTDCFVAGFNTNLSGPTSRIFSTYLGGSGADQCYGIAVDKGPLPHNVYVVGRTTSTNFPLATKLNGNNRGGSDAIVVKLKADGSALLYSVYLGGSADEWGFGIAVDSAGQAYVTGRTTSSNFPVLGGFQTILRDPTGDAFITKINAAGNAFLYSTYLGGNGTDQGNGIAVDPGGIAYVTGHTASLTNFPTKNGFQVTRGGCDAFGNCDAFVAKVDTTLTGDASLRYSTYLGGSGADFGFGIATDGTSAYVTGQTASSDLYSILTPPPPLPPQPPPPPLFYNKTLTGPSDAFVARIDTASSGQASVAFFTYLGGGGDDSGTAIAVDAIGDAYVTGWTTSTNFPTTAGSFQPYQGNGDAFVARLNTDINGSPALVYGLYLGGTGTDQGWGIALDPAGDGYVMGSTSSTTNHFPTTPGGFQTTYGGTTDAFVMRISDIAKTADLSITKTGPGLVGAGAQFAYTLSVKNAGPNAASNVTVSDTLPTGVTLVSASGMGWSCSSPPGTTMVTCTLDSLAAPPAPTPANPNPLPVTAPAVTITVTAPAEGNQTLSNRASVSSDTPLLHPENSSSNEVQTTVTPRADLSITKTVSAPGVNAGTQFTYTLSVKNAGPSTASAVTVSDTLPGGVTLVGASGVGWNCSGTPTVTCTRAGSGGSPASLPVGSAPDIVLSVTASGASATIFNQASVSSETSDPNPSNNSATAQTVVNQLVNEGAPLSFQVPATDASGNPLTYSASNLPQGASFDPGTRTFTWTPNSAQGGPNPYLVYFTGSNGTGSNGQSPTTTAVKITVVDVVGDRDFDGVPDDVDNCPDAFNPDQSDVCHRSPETVIAESALSQSTSAQGALNLTFTAKFSGGTNGTYYVPTNLFNTICRVTDGAGQLVRAGAVADGPPINLSPSGLIRVAPGTTLDSATTFDLKLLYPNLVSGTYTVACDYVSFAQIPIPEQGDVQPWKGTASAQAQTVIVGLYAFSGFASPADHEPFNLGRTVPVKFSLKDNAGAFVTTATARLFVQQLDSQGNKVGDPIPARSTNSPDNQFRYDFNNNQYIFNMSTDTLTAGLWQLVVKLNNGTTETIVIVLRM